MAFSLAVRIAVSVAVDAESCITPSNSEGSPINSRNHIIIFSSSSAAAGEVSQIIHWVPRVAISISASIDAGLVFAGKYAKKLGFCQWVIPGIIISLKSLISESNDSECKGGLSGILSKISPGLTDDLTGQFSTFSI